MDPEHPQPEHITSAMVLADGVATRYRRLGSGPVVVVLGVEPVVRLLSREYRVIAPETPPGLEATGPEGRARWLSGIFDGLGIESAAVVTSQALSGTVSRYAAQAPDRVQGVVVAGDSPIEVLTAVTRVFR